MTTAKETALHYLLESEWWKIQPYASGFKAWMTCMSHPRHKGSDPQWDVWSEVALIANEVLVEEKAKRIELFLKLCNPDLDVIPGTIVR